MSINFDEIDERADQLEQLGISNVSRKKRRQSSTRSSRKSSVIDEIIDMKEALFDEANPDQDGRKISIPLDLTPALFEQTTEAQSTSNSPSPSPSPNSKRERRNSVTLFGKEYDTPASPASPAQRTNDLTSLDSIFGGIDDSPSRSILGRSPKRPSSAKERMRTSGQGRMGAGQGLLEGTKITTTTTAPKPPPPRLHSAEDRFPVTNHASRGAMNTSNTRKARLMDEEDDDDGFIRDVDGQLPSGFDDDEFQKFHQRHLQGRSSSSNVSYSAQTDRSGSSSTTFTRSLESIKGQNQGRSQSAMPKRWQKAKQVLVHESVPQHNRFQSDSENSPLNVSHLVAHASKAQYPISDTLARMNRVKFKDIPDDQVVFAERIASMRSLGQELEKEIQPLTDNTHTIPVAFESTKASRASANNNANLNLDKVEITDKPDPLVFARYGGLGTDQKAMDAHAKWLTYAQYPLQRKQEIEKKQVKKLVNVHRPFSALRREVDAHNWGSNVRSLVSNNASFGAENINVKLVVQGKKERVIVPHSEQEKRARNASHIAHVGSERRREYSMRTHNKGESSQDLLRRIHADVTSHVLSVRLKGYTELDVRARKSKFFREMANSHGLTASMVANFVNLIAPKPRRSDTIMNSQGKEVLNESLSQSMRKSRRERMIKAQRNHLQRKLSATLGHSRAQLASPSITKKRSANYAGLTEFKALIMSLGSLCDNSIANRTVFREGGGVEHLVTLIDSQSSYVYHVVPLIIQTCEQDMMNQLDFMKYDGAEALLDLLDRELDVEVLTGTLAAICSLGQANRVVMKHFFVNLDLTSKLFDLMDRHFGRYRLLETMWLSLIFAASEDPECKEYLVRNFALDGLLQLIDTQMISPKLLENLGDLCENHKDLQNSLRNMGIFTRVAHFIDHQDASFEVAAMKLAIGLSKRNPKNMKVLTRLIKPDVVIEFLETRWEMEQREIAARLGYILANHSRNSRLALGIMLPTVIAQLANEPEARCVAYFGFISACCSGCEANQETFRNHGGIDVLGMLLERQDMTREQTSAALVATVEVCKDNPFNVTTMIRCLETEVLYRAISSLPNETEYHREALKLFGIVQEAQGNISFESDGEEERDDDDGQKSTGMKKRQTDEPLLLFATRELNVKEMRRLMEDVDVDPNSSGDLGMTALHVIATMKSDKRQQTLDDMCDLLLDFDADLDALDRKGRTPLLICIRGNNEKMFEWLLDNGANPNARNRNGRTMLHCLMDYVEDWDRSESFDRMFVKLLACGADVEACVTTDENDVVSKAKQLQRVLMVEELTREGSTDEEGME